MLTAMKCIVALAAGLVAALPAAAAPCDKVQRPSPGSEVPSRITFTNETGADIQVYWVDFDGKLVAYGNPIADGGEMVQKTYRQHEWYVEIAAEGGAQCVGPIRNDARKRCAVTIGSGGAVAGTCTF